MNKFFSYPVFVVLFLSFIVTMGFGAIVKHHLEGGQKLKFLQKPVMLIASTPSNVKKMLTLGSINLDKIEGLKKHKDKKRFEQSIENKRNALLVLPRYEHKLSRAVVDIIDLNNFEVIHTYKHDIDEMNNQIENTKEFPKITINNSPTRFYYQNPLIFEDGSLMGINGPAYKIDFCSNLQWINDHEYFHHSQNIDHEGNIWVGAHMKPESQYIKKYSIKGYFDDAIVKLNTSGKIIFNKSITELLIENDIFQNNFPLTTSLKNRNLNSYDPIHLNDIEPAFNDTEYWQQGDVFISIRTQSAIIHYRPSTNKVINYITGPFAEQHDVDIISDEEISIFNNNNFLVNNEHSEVIVYNFKTKTFKKIFNDQLRKENFKTITEGLSHTFKDGSLMVEETNHGRIILFNNRGEKEWEFVNRDKNGIIGAVHWSRLIEEELFIEKFKSLIKNKRCLN